jgi:hypothetical protein
MTSQNRARGQIEWLKKNGNARTLAARKSVVDGQTWSDILTEYMLA